MYVARVIAEDQLEIVSLRGVAGSLPFTLTDQDTGEPEDISVYIARLEIFTGSADSGPSDPAYTVLSFTEDDGGGITRDEPTGTFTVAMTQTQSEELPVDGYGFRFLFFDADDPDTCLERPFYGRWLHRRAR